MQMPLRRTRWCYSTYLVTIETFHAAFFYICRVPITLVLTDEWPQYSIGKNCTQEGGDINYMWADHPGADVCHAKVKEESDKTKHGELRKSAAHQKLWRSAMRNRNVKRITSASRP
jgi:hypothetical protein